MADSETVGENKRNEMSSKADKKSTKKNQKPSLLYTMIVSAPKKESISKSSNQLGTKTRIPESLGVKLETSKFSSARNTKSFRFI